VSIFPIRARDDTPLAEKIQQQDRRILSQDAADRFDSVVEVRSQNPQRLEATDRANLEIRRPEHEPGHTCVNRCTEAHQTRFDGAVQSGADQPVVSETLGGIAHRQHFRVGGRIVQCKRRVVAPTDNLATGDHHRADRDLSSLPRERGLLESYPHEALMLVHRRVASGARLK
jgi:hypothetical protein